MLTRWSSSSLRTDLSQGQADLGASRQGLVLNFLLRKMLEPGVGSAGHLSSLTRVSLSSEGVNSLDSGRAWPKYQLC